MMIQEREGTVARERGQPERQPRKLHGHRVDVHAEETALRHRAPKTGSIAIADVLRRHHAVVNQRRLVRQREIAARRHQERAASHRGVQHAQRQDSIGRRIAHERRERPADQVLRQRARRVEGAGRLAASGAHERQSGRAAAGPRPPRSRGSVRTLRRAARPRGPRTRCAAVPPRPALVVNASKRLPHRAVVQRGRFRERRVHGGEEPSVERRHAQRSRAAAPVREPRDRLQRFPQALRPGQHFHRRSERLDRVAARDRSDATSAPALALRRTAETGCGR